MNYPNRETLKAARVGAEVDLGASFSVDWKPIPHFGLTAGYNILKLTDSVASRDLTVKVTAHGPTVGFGLFDG